MKRSWKTGAILGLALTAAACGSGDAATRETATTAAPTQSTMEISDMNVGDASIIRADVIDDADVAWGPFGLLDTAPFGYDDAAGTVWLARHDRGTTVTVELSGILPNSPHIAHLHAGSCADAGGPHFQFEPDGGTMPPNEIHLRFTSEPDGSGLMTAENARVVGPEARSVVVHPVNSMDAKVVCAELG